MKFFIVVIEWAELMRFFYCYVFPVDSSYAIGKIPCFIKIICNLFSICFWFGHPRKKNDATEALAELASKRFAGNKSKKLLAITNPWGVKFVRMTNDQRILCEKFVEDILFEGQMGTLYRHSVNEPNCCHATPITYHSRGNSTSLVQHFTSYFNDVDTSQSPLANYFT